MGAGFGLLREESFELCNKKIVRAEIVQNADIFEENETARALARAARNAREPLAAGKTRRNDSGNHN
jgi:hypothetical protein